VNLACQDQGRLRHFRPRIVFGFGQSFRGKVLFNNDFVDLIDNVAEASISVGECGERIPGDGCLVADSANSQKHGVLIFLGNVHARDSERIETICKNFFESYLASHLMKQDPFQADFGWDANRISVFEKRLSKHCIKKPAIGSYLSRFGSLSLRFYREPRKFDPQPAPNGVGTGAIQFKTMIIQIKMTIIYLETMPI
jgi:hypothetical protein